MFPTSLSSPPLQIGDDENACGFVRGLRVFRHGMKSSVGACIFFCGERQCLSSDSAKGLCDLEVVKACGFKWKAVCFLTVFLLSF